MGERSLRQGLDEAYLATLSRESSTCGGQGSSARGTRVIRALLEEYGQPSNNWEAQTRRQARSGQLVWSFTLNGQRLPYLEDHSLFLRAVQQLSKQDAMLSSEDLKALRRGTPRSQRKRTLEEASAEPEASQPQQQGTSSSSSEGCGDSGTRSTPHSGNTGELELVPKHPRKTRSAAMVAGIAVQSLQGEDIRLLETLAAKLGAQHKLNELEKRLAATEKRAEDAIDRANLAERRAADAEAMVEKYHDIPRQFTALSRESE